MNDFQIGPAGGCSYCYRRPCICSETATQRKKRQEVERTNCHRCYRPKAEHKLAGSILICPGSIYVGETGEEGT